jgi:hypothetical protein
MKLPTTANVFGTTVRWQNCTTCGNQVFTASPAKDALCGICDNNEAEQETRNFKKAKIPNRIRWDVWERDDFTCKKCGSRRDLTVDHIHPESKGGRATLENCQTLCRTCNSSKGAR